MTEERGDESRPRDKTQHGARGLLPGPRKQRFLFSSTKWRNVIYGQPASVWSKGRHRFMSAIMDCPCYQGEDLKGWVRRGVDEEGEGLWPLRARPYGKVHCVSSLSNCESVTL